MATITEEDGRLLVTIKGLACFVTFEDALLSILDGWRVWRVTSYPERLHAILARHGYIA